MTINKHWLTISTVFLAMIGGVAVYTTTGHADAVTQFPQSSHFNRTANNSYNTSPRQNSSVSTVNTVSASQDLSQSSASTLTQSISEPTYAPSVSNTLSSSMAANNINYAPKVLGISRQNLTQNDNSTDIGHMVNNISVDLKNDINQDAHSTQNYIHRMGLRIPDLRSSPLTVNANLSKLAITIAQQKLLQLKSIPFSDDMKRAGVPKEPIHMNVLITEHDPKGNLIINTPGNPSPLILQSTNASSIASGINNDFMEYNSNPHWQNRANILDPNDTALGIGVGYSSGTHDYCIVELFRHKPESPATRKQIAQEAVDTLSGKVYAFANSAAGHHAGVRAYIDALQKGLSKQSAFSMANSANSGYKQDCLKQTSFSSLLTPQRSSEATSYYNHYIAPDLQKAHQWLQPKLSMVNSLEAEPQEKRSITPQMMSLAKQFSDPSTQEAYNETMTQINNIRKQYGAAPLKPSFELQIIADTRVPQMLDIYDYLDDFFGWRSIHKNAQNQSYTQVNAHKLHFDNESLGGENAGMGFTGKGHNTNPGYSSTTTFVRNGKDMADCTFDGMTQSDQSQGNGHLKNMVNKKYKYIGIAFYYFPNIHNYVMATDFSVRPTPDPDLLGAQDSDPSRHPSSAAMNNGTIPNNNGGSSETTNTSTSTSASNKASNANNGQANNSNPNNNTANNIITSGTSGGNDNTVNNNNIVPSGPIINNNDAPAYYNLDNDDEMVAYLSNTEDQNYQDMLNRLSSDYQFQESEDTMIDNSLASLSAAVVNNEAQNTNISDMTSLSDSAELQSLSNDIQSNEQQEQLNSSIMAERDSDMAAINNVNYYANDLVQSAVNGINNDTNLTSSEHHQLMSKAFGKADGYTKMVDQEPDLGNKDDLSAQMSAIIAQADRDNQADQQFNVDHALDDINIQTSRLLDFINNASDLSLNQKSLATNEVQRYSNEADSDINNNKSNNSLLQDAVLMMKMHSSQIQFSINAEVSFNKNMQHTQNEIMPPTNTMLSTTSNVQAPQNQSNTESAFNTDWSIFMNNLNDNIHRQTTAKNVYETYIPEWYYNYNESYEPFYSNYLGADTLGGYYPLNYLNSWYL